MEKKKGIQELSIDTQIIFGRLVTIQPGEMVTYTELSKLIGRNVQAFGRHYLYTAQNMALRDNKMVFVAVRNEGIKRLTNEAIPTTIGINAITKIRKAAKRSAKKIAASDYDSLSQESKITHNMGLSVLGAFMQMTKAKSIKIIEDTIRINDLNKLTYAKTLEQFKTA